MENTPFFSIYDWIKAKSQRRYIKSANGQHKFEEEMPDVFKRIPFEKHQYELIYREDNVTRFFKWDDKEEVIAVYQVDPPNIPKELEGLEFEMFTTDGEPVMKYGVQRLRGYGEISSALYGTQVADINRRIAHLLTVDDFDPNKLFVEEEIDQGKYKYTLYRYNGNQKIRGLEGLKTRFPNTNIKKFEREFPIFRLRHQELLEDYQIKKIKDQYIVEMAHIFPSQNKVVEFLKKERDETVSTYTQREMFKIIGEFKLEDLIDYYKLVYSKKSKTYDFIIDGQFYPDQKIEHFLELLPFEPYKGMRDDLIKILS